MPNFSVLLCVGLIIRLLVILYGEWHDRMFVVPFTDVDYHVFSDAAGYVANDMSPYLRFTYRYPPILAWLLVPNVTCHAAYGKILFSLLDLLVSSLIKVVVRDQGFSEVTATLSAMFWLFNPVSILISTRGNSDSLIGAVVLVALIAVTRDRPALAGIFIGLAIHIRLYPIVYSLPMYLSLKTPNNSKGVLKYIIPNRKQLTLVGTCILFLATVTSFCYHLYGYEFLQESLFYHLTRKDTRHNFSLFFYLLYLNCEQPAFLLFLPQFVLLIVFSAAFHDKKNLPFCLFAQSFVVVAYNPVVTSQYWIWVLSLLAPNIPRLKLTFRQTLSLSGLWILSQTAWLFPAYLLEFRGKNTFLFIWLQGVGVFCANIAVLARFVRDYDFHKPREHIKQE